MMPALQQQSTSLTGIADTKQELRAQWRAAAEALLLSPDTAHLQVSGVRVDWRTCALDVLVPAAAATQRVVSGVAAALASVGLAVAGSSPLNQQQQWGDAVSTAEQQQAQQQHLRQPCCSTAPAVDLTAPSLARLSSQGRDTVLCVPAAPKQLCRVRLQVAGMTCASCVSAVEGAFLRLPGVKVASVNLLLGTATVDYEVASGLTPQAVAAAAEDIGFDATLVEEDARQGGGAGGAAGAGSAPSRELLRVSVGGMTCSQCVRAIEQALAQVRSKHCRDASCRLS